MLSYLHDLILQLGQEVVHNLVLLDGQRVKVDLLHAVDLAGLDETTELGDGLPLLLLALAAAATTAALTASGAETTASSTTVSHFCCWEICCDVWVGVVCIGGRGLASLPLVVNFFRCVGAGCWRGAVGRARIFGCGLGEP